MLSASYNNQTFLIFLHIQKTAGMTVQRYLRKQLGPGAFTRIRWRLFKDTRLSGDRIVAAKARKMRDRHFSGHFSFGIHHYLPMPSTYMTFVRDPAARIISLYEFSQSNPASYYHNFAKHRTLGEFVLESELMELDNGMVRFISGSNGGDFINRTPLGELDEAALSSAKENLDRFFCFVGVQEAFDKSFLLLSHVLGDTKPRYITLNEGRRRTRNTVIDAATLQAIEERSRLDRELYNYAVARMSADFARAFGDEAEALRVFREKNEIYNHKWASTYRKLSRFRRGGF